MQHGAPDFDKYRRGSTSFPVQDMAELAARLDSVNVHDRRGDQIWSDSFEYGLNKWEPFPFPAFGSSTIVPTHTRHGGYSCRLFADAVVGGRAAINAWLPHPPTPTLGYEIASTLDDYAESVTFSLHVLAAGVHLLGSIRYLPPTDTLQYLPAVGGYVDITTNLLLMSRNSLFHVFKFVLDIQTQRYVRVIADHHQWDLRGIAAQVTPIGAREHAQIAVTLDGDNEHEVEIFVDSAIVTEDEPYHIRPPLP